MEAIQGDVQWDINWADITNFYGGGVNAVNPITGNIQVDITNSYVNQYCGGPKFGDMVEDKTVITNATDCVFGTYFGAGYGGNAYKRLKYKDVKDTEPAAHQGQYSSERGKYYDGKTSSTSYGKKGKGVATDFDYEFFIWSSGTTGARFYVQFVSFSLARTNNVTSNLTGCTINENFYGGGNLGKVNDTATSTLDSCTVKGDVYGGGYSASIPKIAVRNTPAFVSGKEPSKNINIGMFEEGEIAGTVEYEWKQVENLPNNGKPGTEDDKYVLTDENLTTLGQVKNSNLIIKGSTVVMGDVYGGGALASMDTDGETKVNLIGGTINGDVYGGGMGRLAAAAVGTEGTPGYVAAVTAVEAKVGNTNVNLNGIDATDYKTEYYSFMEQKVANGPYTMKDAAKGCVVKGNIFGCNNLNGTPKGSVTVHVYATQNASANQISNNTSVDNAKVQERFDVNAVYGGGNLAAYEPTDLTNGKTNVIIDGCDRTSIKQVYGGGNAASTPATEVTINGTYEVEEVFGGGNGKDDITINSETKPNPGANVGYKDYSEYTTEDGQLVVVDKDDADTPDERANNYSYGSGEAKVNIYGGLIHRVYGGSNTKGNVRQIAVAMLEDEESCDFHVDEAYGGGKSANMDGEARLEMKCIPGLNAAYGGAENADISNNVTLNITNGKFGQVFGGNNRGGRIMGSITVNIEETGCRPVIIGELYGGGNRAGDSIYGYTEELEGGEIKLTDGKPHWLPLKEGDDNALATPYDSPQVNVKSFTSIGNVFGGGYGETAVMVGDPTVNINVVVGDKTSHNEAKIETEGTIQLREDNEQGQEPIYRNVKYPTHVQGKIGAINNVFGGGNAAKVIGSPKVNVGTAEKVTYVTKATGDTNYREFTTGIGADIRGNVYGGGNNAEVTGDTDVQIGRKAN